MQIEIHIDLPHPFEQTPIPEQLWQGWLQTWLEYLQPQLSDQELLFAQEAYSLSLRLTDDLEIQQLNAHYRQQDHPTDVLAFAALEDTVALEIYQAGEPVYLGDIVISLETAQRQAQTQAHPLETELAWLAAHGLLHLLGWDHPDQASLDRMLTIQAQLLTQVNIQSP